MQIFRIIACLILLCTPNVYGQVNVTTTFDLCDSPRLVSLSVANYSIDNHYYWTSKDGLFAPTYGQDISFYITEPGSYSLTLSTESNTSSECIVYSTITINAQVCEDWSFYVPSAVSVVGAVENRTWYPKYWNVTINELSIWNRWGELVYDKLEPWDPSNVQNDVYVARIVYTRPINIRETVFYKITVVK